MYDSDTGAAFAELAANAKNINIWQDRLQTRNQPVIFVLMTRCIALCIPLLWGTAASASDSPVIAVVGLHQADVHLDQQEKASRAIANAIDKTKRATAVHGPDFTPGLAGRQKVILEEALLTAGRQQLAEGRNFYNQAEPEQAVAVLERAIDSLATGAVMSGDFRDLWDAWVFLGTAQVALGNEDGATDAFRNAVAINESRSPDTALFPPNVTELFDAVRTESRSKLGTLRLTLPDPVVPLNVQLDGEAAGRLPVTIDNLTPGVHHIRALGAGQMAVTSIDVTGAMALELDVTEPTLGPAAGSAARRSREAEALYRALGRQIEDVDYVLLAGTEGNLLNLQLYDVSADIFSTPTSTPYSGTADDEALSAVTLLMNLLEPGGGLPDIATQSGAVPLDRGANPLLASMLLEPIDTTRPPPRRKRTGLWVGLGVGVVAVGAAATVAVINTQGPRYNGKIQIGSF